MKVGIIGTGFGQYAVAPVFTKIGCEVEVVTPRDSAAVERLVASKVDLVSIHSPPFMHHDHVMLALKHGRNVLCDKPFGLNGAQARAMRDAARKAGVLAFSNFEMRLKPSRAKIKELADSGAIGKPLHLSWCFISNGFRGGPYGWINEKDKGGGWINSMGSHLIDFTSYLFDSKIVKCGGIARIEDPMHPDKAGVLQRATAEDAYSAWFVTENGCTATHDTAYCAAAPMPMRVTLMGTKGALELVGDTKLTVRRMVDPTGLSAEERIKRGLLAGEGDEVYEFKPAPGEAHEPLLIPWFTRIKDAIAAGQQIAPSFDDGVAVQEAMDMLRANAVHL